MSTYPYPHRWPIVGGLRCKCDCGACPDYGLFAPTDDPGVGGEGCAAALREALGRAERQRDTLRAQLAALAAKADPRIGDLAAKVRAGDGTAEDLRVLCDVAERVAMLEALVAEKDETFAEALATLLNERGEGEPPEPGWTWYVSGQVREWRRGGERVIPAHPGQWEVHAHGRERITRATARDAIKAANVARKG